MKSLLSPFFRISNHRGFAVDYGGFFRLRHEQSNHLRGWRVQGKQINSSSMPMYFLFRSFTFCGFYCVNNQMSSVLSHPPSLCAIQERLPVVQKTLLKHNTLLCYPITSRSFYSVAGAKEQSFVNRKENADEKEVNMVCKLMEETFACDLSMEKVLGDYGFDLSHDLVSGVLERFKHAWKPAFRFFCWADGKRGFSHNLNTYNAVVNLLGKNKQFETMLSVLEEMRERNLLTVETFIICIKTFAAAKEKKKAAGILDLMRKLQFKVGVETINCLLDSLARAKLGKEGQAVFEDLEHRFVPNLCTYTILLSGWCRVNNFMEAGRIWNLMVDNGFKPDIVAHNILLEGLLRSKRSDAVKLFEVMKSRGPYPNVKSYTIIIRDLCKHGNMQEAAILMDEVLGFGCEPDAAMYTCLMSGFGNQKKMNIVYRLLKEMTEKGCPPDGQTYNALIKMMTNLRMPDDAAKIYKKMIQSNIQPIIHTFNMMMKSLYHEKL